MAALPWLPDLRLFGDDLDPLAGLQRRLGEAVEHQEALPVFFREGHARGDLRRTVPRLHLVNSQTARLQCRRFGIGEPAEAVRAEERRVANACVSTRRSGWSTCHYKQNEDGVMCTTIATRSTHIEEVRS